MLDLRHTDSSMKAENFMSFGWEEWKREMWNKCKFTRVCTRVIKIKETMTKLDQANNVDSAQSSQNFPPPN